MASPAHDGPRIGQFITLDLPEPVSLRRMLGPGIIAVGIGMAAGELILWPYIHGPGRLPGCCGWRAGHPGGAVRHQHGDRALHPGHRPGRGRRRAFPLVEGLGHPHLRRRAFQYLAGLGDERDHRLTFALGGERHLDHDRGPRGHRGRPHHLTRHLRHRREDRVGEGRPDAGVPGGGAGRGPRLANLDRRRVGDRLDFGRLPSDVSFTLMLSAIRRRRAGGVLAPILSNWITTQALRHGGACAAAGLADHRDRGGR